MPRSPHDATRFTATGPYASSKSSAPTSGTSSTIGTRINFGEAPINESPQQKIARLRAAAQLAKRTKEDGFDKVVRVGRRWADRAHRATVYSLLGLTVVSVLVASAGITDLVLHNRARRRDWYKEQELKRQAAITTAQRALASGTITEDQALLLAQERVKQEAAEANKNKPGIFKRASSYVFGGLAPEEQKGGRLGAAAAAATEKTTSTLAATRDAVVEQLDRNAAGSITNVSAPSSNTVPRSGGILDQHAQHLVDATVQRSNSWRSWLSSSQ